MSVLAPTDSRAEGVVELITRTDGRRDPAPTELQTLSVPVTLTSISRSRSSCTTSLIGAKETTPAELTNAVIRGPHPSISATVASIEA